MGILLVIITISFFCGQGMTVFQVLDNRECDQILEDTTMFQIVIDNEIHGKRVKLSSWLDRKLSSLVLLPLEP
jgi:hypothetical protein